MTTEMLLSIVTRMDQAGFVAMESDSYNAIKMRVLQQKEHHGARIRLLAKKVTKTPLMIIGGCTFGLAGLDPGRHQFGPCSTIKPLSF